MNEQQIQNIVRNVLSEMTGGSSSCKCKSASIPSTAKVAMLTGERKFEYQNFPMPQVGDDEILVRVEGCGVCGTDVHEWKGDPFGYIPIVLGHEGTGEVIALGKNVKEDLAGKPVKVGDKVVTSVSTCGECPMCKNHPDKPNLCESPTLYGLLTDTPEYHLNGWFASHILLRKGSSFFVVNELSLDQRMLLELAAVAVHAAERGKGTGLMNFDSKVLVQGCGPVGLMLIAVLKAMGIRHIIALDGTPKRLEMAKRLGALDVINFKEMSSLEERVNFLKSINSGLGADFVFQCTGVPSAAAEAWKYVRTGGGLCEVGFFTNNGDCTINPHLDICSKEITAIGTWTYGALDYKLTIAFIKTAKEIGLPIEDLITHRFPLEQMDEAMQTNVSQQGIKICIVND